MQRRLAYEILCATLINGEFANLTLKRRLKELPPAHRPLVTELVNGVLRNYLLLAAQFRPYLKSPTKTSLEIILALSLYERFIMGHEAYVTVNEYVKLAGNKQERAFLNALLRKIDTFACPSGDDEALALLYSLPLWLFKLLKAQYTPSEFQAFLTNLKEIPQVYYRLNPKLANWNKLNAYSIKKIDERFFTSAESLIESPLFKKGYFYIQDYNSGQIVDRLALQRGQKYLDVCAAPGAKLFNALECLAEEDVYAADIYPKRLALVKERAAQLGYPAVNYLVHDAREKFAGFNAYFDRILVDAPCSGLGVLKRKPDLRYRLKPSDLDDLVVLQAAILKTSALVLKKGGILVYSTCTLNTKENERQVRAFLKAEPGFKLLKEERLDRYADTDRFYVAQLLKAF